MAQNLLRNKNNKLYPIFEITLDFRKSPEIRSRAGFMRVAFSEAMGVFIRQEERNDSQTGRNINR